MSPDELRIGDAEREQAQTELGEHYAAGRLDHDEYTQRLDQIWAARTRSELAPVFTDLPGPGGSAPVFRATPAQRRTTPTRRPGLPAPLPLVVLLVVLGLVVVLPHLPVILVAVGVWFFFLRGGACGRRSASHHRW